MRAILALITIFAILPKTYASSSTTPFTSQVFYYGDQSNQKTPVKFDIWWDCSNKSFWSHWESSCGYARTEVTSDQNGQIRVPSIKYNTGDRNTFKLTIHAGDGYQEINLSSFDDMKKVASKISIYKINETLINLNLKSGKTQQEWIKNIGREGEIRISGKANHPNLQILNPTTFWQMHLRNNVSDPIRFVDRYMILNGNDYGANLGFDFDFALYSFPLTGNGQWLARNKTSIQYPQQLQNQVLNIDDTKLPNIERSIVGHWSSTSFKLNDQGGSGVFYIEMDLDCRNGQAVGEISLTNTIHDEWASKSLVRGTCDIENEKADLEFDINLGKGIHKYTFAVTKTSVDYFLSKRHLQLITSDNAYFCEFRDPNGNLAANGEISKVIE